MRNRINLKFAVVSLFAALTIHLHAQDVGVSDDDREAILDTIAQINHINWVVNVIKTYNNAMILEEEYEKISYGNLDLNRIPDEETLSRITKTLDTLHSLRKDEREMKHWRDKFKDDRMRKMREYDLNTAKRVWGLFREGIFGFMTGDIGIVLQTAFDVGHGALSLQYDYDDFVHGLDQEVQDRIFAFDSQKLDLIHRQNKELIDDQWRLVRKYRLNDKTTRVTDTDIKELLKILKDGNAARIYTRLAPMKGRYSLFPEYWYYLSCAAMETGHFKEGREACDSFFKVNRGIFRNDPMASTVALNKALMLEKDTNNLPELRRCLEIAWTNNLNRSEWSQDFIVASLYDGALHDNVKAVKILEHAIVGLESEMSERRRMKKSIVPFAGILGEYHAFLFRLLPNEPMPEAIRTSEFISIIDKIRFLARSKTENVWETIKDDICNCGGAEEGIVVPASWLLDKDVTVKLVLSVGQITGVEVNEQVSNRKYNADNNTFTLMFPIEKALEKAFKEAVGKIIGVELLFDKSGIQIQVVFNHPKFPVVLNLAEMGMGYQIGERSPFLFGFTVLSREYLWLPESGVDEPSYSRTVTQQQRHRAFLSKYAFVPLNKSEFTCPNDWVTNGVKLVKIKAGRDEVSVEYCNASGNKFRPNVMVVLMDEYGRVVCAVTDDYFDEYTISERTVDGIFFDDHYADYEYRYMSPNETRIWTLPRPEKVIYLLIRVGDANYKLTETIKL